MRVYLDNCCLSRPFDDPSQVRIALEAEAVAAVLTLCESGGWILVSSDAVEFEVSQTADGSRRAWLNEVLLSAADHIAIDEPIVARAAELESRGFKNMDAIHVSLAEAVGADRLVTCDDQFLKVAKKQTDLKTRIVSSLELVQELET